MYRLALIGAACFAMAGCQSPGSWNPFGGQGYRVPPPPTGSYGPGSYYQPSAPTVPSSTPPTGSRPGLLNRWSSVPADQGPSLASDTSTSSGPVSMSPRAATGRPAASLNGMPVNGIRTASEPGRFTPARSATEIQRDSSSTYAPSNSVQPAAATQPGSSSARTASSATWQSRGVLSEGTPASRP